MSLIWFLLLLSIAAAIGAALRARALLKRYPATARLSAEKRDRLVASEKRWRPGAHAFALVSLVPLAALGYQHIDSFLNRAVELLGSGAVAAIAVWALKKFAGLPLLAVFEGNVTLKSSLTRSAYGLCVAWLFVLALVVYERPALRQAAKAQIFREGP